MHTDGRTDKLHWDPCSGTQAQTGPVGPRFADRTDPVMSTKDSLTRCEHSLAVGSASPLLHMAFSGVIGTTFQHDQNSAER